MKFQRSIFASVFVLLGLVSLVRGEQSLSDPYQILEKHFEAIGGLDRLKSVENTYKEGTITIKGAGLEGTFKQWAERPLKLREETDLKVVTSTSGDNGEFRWNVDANGKIQIQRDETTINEREIKRLMAEYEHLDPHSRNFKLTFEGVEDIDGKDCYVVKITNQIDDNVQLNYYAKSNFYQVKTTMIKPHVEEHVFYADFRTIHGTVLPFHETVNILPSDVTIVVKYTKYNLNVEIDPNLFEPPQQDVEDFIFTGGVCTENIPFQFIENHIYLPINIQGKEGIWVLDCGASVNVIDSSYAAEQGLVFEGPIKAQGASGVVNIYYVTLPKYSLGSIQFQKQKVVAMNLRSLFQKALGLDVVGILGYDFLSRFVTKIDYAKETISFYHPDEFEYQGDGEVIDSPLGESHMFSLQVTVDGKYSGKWVLDIGADGNDFHYPYAKDNDLLERQGIDAMAAGAACEFVVKVSAFETMELDGYKISNVLIGVPHEQGTGVFSQKAVVGNIGNSFLRNFVLYFDYKNQRLIFEKGDNFGKDFPMPKSGLQFCYNANNDVEVVFVSPNTPAHEIGFEKGDIIKAINGIDVQFYNGIIALRKLMRQEAGTIFTVDLLRDTRVMKKQLTLRDLY
jgi:hypothetical protein